MRHAARSPVREDLRLEITGWVLLAVAIWLFISMAGGGGLLGAQVRSGLVYLVGTVAGWVLPAGLLALGGSVLLLRRVATLPPWRLWGCLLLFLVLTTAVQILRYPYLPPGSPAAQAAGQVARFTPEHLARGGGILGWGLEWVLTRLVGHVGRWVVLASGALVGLVLALEISLAQWLRRAGGEAARAGGALAAGAGRLVTGAVRLAPVRLGASRPEGLRPDVVHEVVTRRAGGAAAGKAAAGGPERPAMAAREPAAEEPGFTIHIAGLDDRSAKRAGSAGTSAGRGAAGMAAGSAGSAAAAGGTLASLFRGRRLAPGAEPPAGEAAPGAAPTGAQTDGSPLAGASPAAEARLAAEDRPQAEETGPGPEPVAGSEDRGNGGSDGQGTGARGTNLPAAYQAAPAAQDSGAPATSPAPYQLPPLDLLQSGAQNEPDQDTHQAIVERARLLEEVLATYGVPAKVVEVHQGPAITRFELTLQPGVKVAKVAGLADDLAYHLAARDVRIEAPIPGKRAIGIEVPNQKVVSVYLRDVLESEEWQRHPSRLAVGFGKDIAGKPVIGDLERMPHLLIAGATGSGKSVCMNAIICSLLMRARPDEVKMLMVDPKRVELSVYDGIPHLVAPVVTDPRKAAGYLKWAVKEMEARYDLLAASGTRNIGSYNRWVEEQNAAALAEWEARKARGEDPGEPPALRQPLPYIVIFLDELSDLMMVAPVEVEDSIIRLAQMARACGIHLVIATQRPSVDVITGLIKANIPSRIAFAVSSAVESRIILDMAGAEKLLGKGDMLYYPQGVSKPIRAQGAFVSDREVEALVAFVKRQGQPVYQAEAMAVEGTGARNGRNGEAGGGHGKESALEAVFPEAVRIVIEHGQASVSILQRRLRCNYTKATRLIDMMEERGFIGPHRGPKPREVLITMAQWRELFGQNEAAATAEAREEVDR
ncbi:MAG: DNA translocase FtsK [Firmicutes bacterium]|nr:DNA translocase FtsK [Bacillota bacterium]